MGTILILLADDMAASSSSLPANADFTFTCGMPPQDDSHYNGNDGWVDDTNEEDGGDGDFIDDIVDTMDDWCAKSFSLDLFLKTVY